MFLLILCVEVSQSQGGFEVRSSQFMSLLLGAYLKSRILDIRYHPTSAHKMSFLLSEGIIFSSIQQSPIKHICGPCHNMPQGPRNYKQITQILHNRLCRDVFLDLLTKVTKLLLILLDLTFILHQNNVHHLELRLWSLSDMNFFRILLIRVFCDSSTFPPLLLRSPSDPSSVSKI